MWVISEGDPAKTIIDGEHNKNVVEMDHVVEGGIIGFTIKNSQENGNFAGIKMTGSQTPVIANCIIRNNKHGMFIAGDVRAFIANNLVRDNSHNGIRISGSSQSVIINNILMNNQVGLEANGQPVKISGFNDVWSNAKNYHDIEAGEGAISEFPDFVNADVDNFRLSEFSPLIDAGHYEIPDTNGTRSDIGVYGGMHEYWRNFFISSEMPSGLSPDEYTFGRTGVSISYDSSSLKSSSMQRVTVSRIGKKLFLKDGEKSINRLWNLYSTENTETKKIHFHYDGDKIADNNMDEIRLVLAHYNVGEQKWKKQENSVVNTSSDVISLSVNDLNGYWTIMESKKNDEHTSIHSTENGVSITHVYPNPSDGEEVTIEFSLPQREVMSIHVYNLQGKRLNTLVSKKNWNAGSHSVTWNGTDYNGNKLISDTYMLVFVTRQHVQSKKVIIVK